MSKKIKIFLIASIGLNLLLLGLIAGHSLHRFHPMHSRWEAKLDDLPDDKKALVQNRFEALQTANRQDRQALRDFRQQMETILTAEEFNGERYRETAGQMQSIRSRMADRMASEIGRVAAELTPDERRLMVRQFLKRPHGKGKRPDRMPE